jgi:hypothetical protein
MTKEELVAKTTTTKAEIVAKVLWIISIIVIVGGVVTGGIMGNSMPALTPLYEGSDYMTNTFNWGLCCGIAGIGIVSGVALMGFSVIIDLLLGIYKKNNTAV